jgi:PKD repeat protein
MKNVHGVVTAILIVLAALANLASAIHIQQAGTRIYLDPASNIFYTNETSVGHLFNITIWVENAPSMAAWNLFLEFNDSILYVTRWFEPKNDPQYIFSGKTTNALPSPPEPSHDHVAPGNGSITVAAILFPTPPAQQPSSGSGKLCILEFNTTMLPTKGEVLSSVLNINSTDTYLFDPDGLEIQGVAKEDGLYNFIYNTPPAPYLALDPAFTYLNPYQDATGMAFNAGVSLKDASSNMSITTVTFCLAYNQTIIATEPSNISLNDLWSGPNSITVANDMINITVTGPTRTPNGTEPVSTVRFTILQQGQSPPEPLGNYVSADLNFIYTRFQGSSGEIASASAQKATVRIYAYHPMTAWLSMEPIAFNLSTYVGHRFSINVTVGEVFDLHSVQTKISYDSSLIKVLRVDLGSFFRDLNLTQVDFWNNSEALGYLYPNATVQSIVPTPLPVASGSVFQIDFEGLASGVTSLNFSKPYGIDTLLVDSLGNTIPVTYYETPLQAEFSYSSIKPTIQDTISFVDESKDVGGYLVSWYWDFGDGTASTSKNPVHKFTLKGNHTVALTVTDNNTATSSIVHVVVVHNLPPVANFSFSPANPVVNVDVQFTDTSTDPENLTFSSWHWDFGDGTNSTLQNPAHRFATRRSYNVTLTIADDENATSSIVHVVVVHNLPPVANFSFSPANPVVNVDVQFTDTSTDPENLTFSSWHWDFGDGTNSTLQNPTHKFASEGNYTVTLTVADDQNATNSFSMTISVSEPPAQELPIWIIALIAAIIIIIVSAIIVLKKRKKTT